MKYINAFIGLIFVLGSSCGIAQTRSDLWIEVGTNVPTDKAYHMTFGNHINGTYGLDKALGEKEPPPAPPGLFVLWKAPRSGIPNYPTAGLLAIDYRAYTGSAQKDTFKVWWNQSEISSADFTLTWPDSNYLKAHCTSLKIKIGTDTYDMFKQTTVTIPTAIDNGLTTAMIYKVGATLVESDPQNPPTLLSPTNNATLIPVNPRLIWNHVASGVTNTYQIQVATDASFASIVKDSSMVDSTWQISGLQNCTNYYWRGKTTNANGVSGWSGVFTFKTIPLTPGAPTLSSPANGATDISLTPTLSWTAGDNCTDSYHLQLAKDAGFGTGKIDYWTASTSQVLSTLEQGTTYYWHVKSINTVDSSGWSTSRNFQTVVLTPSAPQLMLPVSGDTTLDPVVGLKWHTSQNTLTYHVQVAADSNFSSIILEDSTLTDTTKTTIALNNCQKYYWRVSAKNAVGAGPYSSKWNFKIKPTTPTAPTLTSPADGATWQSLTPTLSWTAGDICSYSYHIQVAKDSFFTTIVWQGYQVPTSKQLSTLEEDTYYYWRVKSLNQVDSSQFSSLRSFKTLITPPATTQLFSPPNNSTDIDTVSTLVWKSTLKTDTYHLQIATDQTFSAIVFQDSTLTDTTHATPSLTNCMVYYWRVRGKNVAGYGSYSSVWNFKIKPVTPTIPTLLLPADNAINQSLTPTLSWSSSDICSYSYRLQVAKDDTFSNVVADIYTTQLSRTLSTLELNTNYYWHVKSLNTADSSAFTAYRTFKTFQAPPNTPTLSTPVSGDTNQSPTGNLVWNAAQYAETYHLQVGTDPSLSLSSLVINDSTLTGTSFATSGLTNCKWYYWHVSAKNGAGKSAFSSTWSFKVQTALPGVPNLVSPYNSQDSLSEMVRLIWNKADICTRSYFYQVSHNSSFTDTVAIGQITDTTINIGPILGNVYYYWHVRAINYLGGGAFSSTFVFHTTISRPLVPVLLAPTDGATDLTSGITLQWDSASFAKTYHVQLALDQAFANLKLNDSTIARQAGVRPTKAITGLLNSTTYYWRVRAKNDIGTSAWSTIWHFTTLYPPTAPVLNLPANGADKISITPQFDWSVSQRANYYRLQVSEDTVFSKVVFDDSTLTILSWQISNPLKSLTKYYWRVFGKNSAGWGPASTIFYFTTTRTGVANWTLPLTISETGPAYTTIYFGLHPNATAGIDPGLGEFALPPIDPWYFDARFISPYIGEGLLIDILKFNNYSQVDTFQFSFQPDAIGSYPMKISWPKSLVKAVCDSMVIKDQLVSPAIYTRMDRDSTITVINTATRSLFIVKYGAFPMPLGVNPDPIELPKGYMLSQNYPNPFNPTTNLSFSADKSSKIQIKVYDVLGREVAVIADGIYSPGRYTIQWDGKDESGMLLPSGVYYARMIATASSGSATDGNHFVSTRKMIMLK